MCKFCEYVEDRVKFKGISSEITVLNSIEPNYCPYCGTKLKEIEPL